MLYHHHFTDGDRYVRCVQASSRFLPEQKHMSLTSTAHKVLKMIY